MHRCRRAGSLAVAGAISLGLVAACGSDDERAVDAIVPDAAGRQQVFAEIELEARGFEVRVTRVSDRRHRGIVVTQDPESGERVPVGSTVELEVSRGGAR